MDVNRTEELRLLRKTVLTIMFIVLALFPAHGQDNRKNEIGLLLGGTFTPILMLRVRAQTDWKLGRALHSN